MTVILPEGTDPTKPVDVLGLEGYGTRDLHPQDGNKLYLYLPNGDYAFTVNGTEYVATVEGYASLAYRILPEGTPFKTFGDGMHYIESASGACIVTCVKASATLCAEMDFVPLECTSDLSLGMITSADTDDWRFFNHSQGFTFDCGAIRVGMKSKLTQGNRYHVSVGRESETVYATVTSVDENYNYTAKFSGSVAKQDVQACASAMRLYSLKLYDTVDGKANQLVRDFVPFQTTDGTEVAGLYDRVTQKCFVNAGGGSLTLGESQPVAVTVTVTPIEGALITVKDADGNEITHDGNNVYRIPPGDFTVTYAPAPGWKFESVTKTYNTDNLPVRNEINGTVEPKEVYTITYMYDDEALTELTPKIYTVEDEVTLPTSLGIDGVTLEGWYNDAGFTEGPVTKIATGSTGNRTFYAKTTAAGPICTGGAIAKEGGEWVVKPTGNATEVEITGLPTGDSVVVPPTVTKVTGAEDGKIIVKSGTHDITCAFTITDGAIALNPAGVVNGVRVQPIIGKLDGEDAATQPFVVGEGGVEVTVKAISGLKYELVRTGALAAPAAENGGGTVWGAVGEPVVAEDATVTLTDGNPPEGAAFYRVVVSVPGGESPSGGATGDEPTPTSR